MAKNKLRFKGFIPAIIWFILMCILFFLPGRDVPSIGWAEKLQIDKIAHFILFFVLIILLCLPVLKSSISHSRKLQATFYIAVAAVLWGILVEFIQHNYVPGRTFDLWDWVADSFGVGIAILFIQRIKSAFPD